MAGLMIYSLSQPYIKIVLLWFLVGYLNSSRGYSKTLISPTPLTEGYAQISFVFNHNLKRFKIENTSEKIQQIKTFCSRLGQEYRRYRWNDEPCGNVNWLADYKTQNGHPLIYAEFGKGADTTLFLGGVHPDELTPIHISFRFARYLEEHKDLYEKQEIRVIIAPIVNPDGFFVSNPQRTNLIVDVNRNFFTLDWYQNAIEAWTSRRQSLPRYFPGYFPNTEIETIFQAFLIEKFRPDKIFSLHAPLGFYDYDGPGDQKPRHLSETEQKAKEFVQSVSEKSHNYRVVDYSFYPGSLGNYAGNERMVPTITLELETTNPQQVDAYWEKFLPGFIHSIYYKFKSSHNHKHLVTDEID